jgi:cytochrome P450
MFKEDKRINRPKPIKKRKAEKLPIPDGPRNKKITGSLTEYASSGPKFLMGLEREYGDAASFYINGELYIALFKPSLVDALYTSKQNSFIKGKAFLKMKRGLGESILTTDQPIHLKHRRMMQESFNRENLEKYLGIIHKEVDKKIDSIANKTSIDLYEEMESLSFSMISNCLFSSDLKEYEKEIRKVMPIGSNRALILSIAPKIFSSSIIPIKWFRDYHTSGNKMFSLSNKIIKDRKKTLNKNRDLLNILLYSKDQNESLLSEAEAQYEILALLLAGYDTTAILITMSIFWLQANPEILKKFIDESKKEKWIIENRTPSLSDISNPLLIDKIIKETLRLSAPGWLTPRQSKEDLWIEDVFIPKGAHVIVSQYVSHRNKKYFDKPFSWKPERWTGNFEKELPKGVYYPFGSGSRKCIGENLAWSEAKIALTMMAAKTSWTIISKSNSVSKINYRITAYPAEKILFGIEKNNSTML